MLCGWEEGSCLQPEIRKLSPTFWLNVSVAMVISQVNNLSLVVINTMMSCMISQSYSLLATNHVIGGDRDRLTSWCHIWCLHPDNIMYCYIWCHNYITSTQLTGCSVVTTPYSFTTLGWLNCPMMAASCRNLTLSSSFTPGFRVLTATGTSPSGDRHTPLSTVPNWPEPRWSTTLHRGHGLMWNKLSMTP